MSPTTPTEYDSCDRCDAECLPDSGCPDCHVHDEGGSSLRDEIDEHAHRHYEKGWSKLSPQERWALIKDHT